MVSEYQMKEVVGAHGSMLYPRVTSMLRCWEHDVSLQLDWVMLEKLIATIKFAEASPPRAVAVARVIGLRAGWRLGPTTHDVDGRVLDFDDKEMRNRAARNMIEYQPLLSIGSPMCRSTL